MANTRAQDIAKFVEIATPDPEGARWFVAVRQANEWWEQGNDIKDLARLFLDGLMPLPKDMAELAVDLWANDDQFDELAEAEASENRTTDLAELTQWQLRREAAAKREPRAPR